MYIRICKYDVYSLEKGSGEYCRVTANQVQKTLLSKEDVLQSGSVTVARYEGENRNDEDAHRRRRCFCERISSEVRRTFARKPNGSTNVRKNNPNGVFEGLGFYYIQILYTQTCANMS